MAAGCLLFVPASAASLFAAFLAALFVLAAGITVIQVVANPLISLLGPPATAHSRLTFAQAFNSLGTTIFPYVGSVLILGSISNIDSSRLPEAARAVFRMHESHLIVRVYLGLAAAILVVAAVVWTRRRRLQEIPDEDPSALGHPRALLRRPRFAFGVLCIFLYVGAEVSIGSLIVFYLEQQSVLGLSAVDAGKHVPFYWGASSALICCGWSLRARCSPATRLRCSSCCSPRRTPAGSLRRGRCLPWGSSIQSCFPLFSRWRARDWGRAPNRARVSSAWPLWAVQSCRSSRDTSRIGADCNSRSWPRRCAMWAS